MVKTRRFADLTQVHGRVCLIAKVLAPMLNRETIELLAGFFAILIFGVVLVWNRQ